MVLEQLAAAIESIEHRGRWVDARDRRTAIVSTGWPAIDALLGGGLTRGALHEWFGMMMVEGGASAWFPPLAILSHLAWRAIERRSQSRHSPLVIWIGRACWPHPRAMLRTVIDRDQVPDDRHLLEPDRGRSP